MNGTGMSYDTDMSELYSLVDECNALNEIAALTELVRTQFRKLFPHEIAACGVSDFSTNRVFRLINIDYPRGYLQRIISPDQIILSPVLPLWSMTQTPLLVRPVQFTAIENFPWRRAAHDFKIDTIASHGVADARAKSFSFFTFGNLDTRAIEAYRRVLALVIPHFHAALVRILSRQTDTPPALAVSPALTPLALTSREKQVLKYISLGKSNREIAAQFAVSEFTIKTHVQNLLEKFSSTNRTQMVAKAIAQGLLDV
jgi:DNA-binding CsgD family transcriptional regulator